MRTSAVRRGLTVALTTLVAAGLIGTLSVTVPAWGDPGSNSSGSSSSAPLPIQPSNAGEAKQAWLNSAADSEAANEALLQAQEDQRKAQDEVAASKVTLAQAMLDADTAQADAVQSAAKYELFRNDLAQFASASFRGASLGQLSALLTAESTSDYLDEVSSLDQVAGANRALMIEALQAKDAADQASEAAVAAQQTAQSASERAGKALTSAKQATQEVADRKAKLDSQVQVYHRLYSALSGQEREAAMQAQQAAWEAQANAAALQAASEDQVAPQGAPLAPADGPATTAELSSGDVADGPSVGSAVDTASPKAQIAIQAALTKLGMPYVYGASGPNAYDCSGLTSWAWAQAGVSLPRTSSGQASLPVVPLDQLQPGDLITYYSPVHHVALYIGNGQIIHASTEGKPVFITNMYRGGPYPVGHRVNY